jgi:type I restriction enzyme S subunit
MSWRTVSLSALKASVPYAFVGGPFGSNLTTRDYVDEGVPVIRGINLPADALFLDDDFVFVSETKADELRANEAHPGDVIFTQRGTLGRVGLIPKDARFERYIISQSQMKLTVDPDAADARFILYFFRLPETIQKVISHALTSGVPHINLKILKGFKINLPAEVTQQIRIADVLSAYDNLIENNRRRIGLLEGAARQLFSEWFVRLRFPGYERTRMVDGVPDGWERKTLGEIAENFDRLRVPLSVFERDIRPGIYPYHGAAGILDHIDGYLFDGRFLLVGEDGTVQTPAGTPMLQLVEGKFWVSNHAHVLSGRVVSTEFLWCSLALYQIGGHVTGVAQPKLTQGNLNRVPILVPTRALLSRFQDLVMPLVEQRFVLLRQIEALRAGRDLLLPRLMSGEISV